MDDKRFHLRVNQGRARVAELNADPRALTLRGHEI